MGLKHFTTTAFCFSECKHAPVVWQTLQTSDCRSRSAAGPSARPQTAPCTPPAPSASQSPRHRPPRPRPRPCVRCSLLQTGEHSAVGRGLKGSMLCSGSVPALMSSTKGFADRDPVGARRLVSMWRPSKCSPAVSFGTRTVNRPATTAGTLTTGISGGCMYGQSSLELCTSEADVVVELDSSLTFIHSKRKRPGAPSGATAPSGLRKNHLLNTCVMCPDVLSYSHSYLVFFSMIHSNFLCVV